MGGGIGMIGIGGIYEGVKRIRGMRRMKRGIRRIWLGGVVAGGGLLGGLFSVSLGEEVFGGVGGYQRGLLWAGVVLVLMLDVWIVYYREIIGRNIEDQTNDSERRVQVIRRQVDPNANPGLAIEMFRKGIKREKEVEMSNFPSIIYQTSSNRFSLKKKPENKNDIPSEPSISKDVKRMSIMHHSRLRGKTLNASSLKSVIKSTFTKHFSSNKKRKPIDKANFQQMEDSKKAPLNQVRHGHTKSLSLRQEKIFSKGSDFLYQKSKVSDNAPTDSERSLNREEGDIHPSQENCQTSPPPKKGHKRLPNSMNLNYQPVFRTPTKQADKQQLKQEIEIEENPEKTSESPSKQRPLSSELSKSLQKDSNSSLKSCSICFNRPSDAVFFPCGHSNLCEQCASDIFKNIGSCCFCRVGVDFMLVLEQQEADFESRKVRKGIKFE